MRPRVFVPHVPTRYDPASETRISAVDLRPAMPFGQLVMLLPQGHSLSISETADAFHEIQERLEEEGIGPDDYVLCLGDPLLIVAAVSQQLRMYGRCRALRWHRINQTYELVELQQ